MNSQNILLKQMNDNSILNPTQNINNLLNKETHNDTLNSIVVNNLQHQFSKDEITNSGSKEITTHRSNGKRDSSTNLHNNANHHTSLNHSNRNNNY